MSSIIATSTYYDMPRYTKMRDFGQKQWGKIWCLFLDFFYKNLQFYNIVG